MCVMFEIDAKRHDHLNSGWIVCEMVDLTFLFCTSTSWSRELMELTVLFCTSGSWSRELVYFKFEIRTMPPTYPKDSWVAC
jgi:hypothetical protein